MFAPVSPPHLRTVTKSSADEDFKEALQMLQQGRGEPVDEILVSICEKTYKSQKELPPIAYSNLTTFILDNACGRFSSKVALVDGTVGKQYTYSQVHESVKRTAAGLASLGVRPKDVVLLLSPNNSEFSIMCLAVVSLGAIIAPSNPLNTQADVAKQLVQASVKFVVTVPAQLSKVQNFNLPTILIGEYNKNSQFKSNAVFLLSEICKDDYIEVAQPVCHADDTCTLLFSSGTTGLSKAVQLSHRNFISAVTAYNTLEPGASTSEDDVCLAIIPMYHVFGLGIVMLATLERGACVVTMERYSLPAMLQHVEKYKITVATLVPPLFVILVKNADIVAKYDLSSLKILATGAAPLREDTMKAIATMFPNCVLRQGYGMTEGPLISFSVMANEQQQWGSVGHLVPGTEARVSHIETAAALQPMANGEIWIRGPQVMKGYLNSPETTAATVDSEGWLRTGDLGYMDNNGYLHIVDRLKEMIKYKTHQYDLVYIAAVDTVGSWDLGDCTRELEAVLLEHPRIMDSAVVPLPDEEAGELPMAFVVKRKGSELTEAEIISFVGKLVAPYKKVRKVEFINAIPKSPAGKILRKELIAKIQKQVS